jgi:hypothetical protein
MIAGTDVSHLFTEAQVRETQVSSRVEEHVADLRDDKTNVHEI